MSWIIGLFTFLLVVNCLLLILLVLIQLPKKEAGMGQAFGGGATDALFGAGSGTALTKMTKYVAAIFFLLTLSLSMMHAHQNKKGAEDYRKLLGQGDKAPDLAPATPANTNAVKVQTNLLLSATASNLVAAVSNAAAKSATNPATPPPVEKK